MAIKKILDDLPHAGQQLDTPEPPAYEPLEHPLITPLLVESWFKKRTHDDDLSLAIPSAGKYRGSNAGKCSRMIGFKWLGIPPSEPHSVADLWRMDLGSTVHEMMQEAVADVHPELSEAEVKVDLNSIGIPGSSHIDLVLSMAKSIQTVEIKSINGFGFKQTAARFKGPPQGPRGTHVIQLATATAALAMLDMPDAKTKVEGGRIIYFSLENLSPDQAARSGTKDDLARFAAEWFYPIERLQRIAFVEADRVGRIETQLKEGTVPIPVVIDDVEPEPHKLKVVNPTTGAAVDTSGVGGRTWQCGYCEYRSMCTQTIDITEVDELMSHPIVVDLTTDTKEPEAE